MVAVVHQQHVYNSRHIWSESRFLPTPPAFHVPVRGGVRVGILPSRLVWKNRKSRMVWLYPMVKKNRRYLYSFWQIDTIHERDGHTDRHILADGQTPHDDIGRAYASHRAAKINKEIGEISDESPMKSAMTLVSLRRLRGGDWSSSSSTWC